MIFENDQQQQQQPKKKKEEEEEKKEEEGKKKKVLWSEIPLVGMGMIREAEEVQKILEESRSKQKSS
jgi:hypothetical protein